jgi:hypothetical protein
MHDKQGGTCLICNQKTKGRGFTLKIMRNFIQETDAIYLDQKCLQLQN